MKADSTYCASCLAPHHAECFAAHGRCKRTRLRGNTHRPPAARSAHWEWQWPAPPIPRRPRIGTRPRRAGGVAALTFGQVDLLDTQGSQQTELLQQLLEHRSAQSQTEADVLRGPAYLGIRLKAAQGLGVEVTAVLPAGPADVGGIQVGDTIVAVGGEAQAAEVNDVASLQRLMTVFQPLERVRVSVMRGASGIPAEFEVTLSEAGPPAQFLTGSESGATYIPAKVLGWDSQSHLLLTIHGRRQRLVLGSYLACRKPDGLNGTGITITQQVAGSKESYHTFSAELPLTEGYSDLLGRTLWLQVPGSEGVQATLPLDISGGPLGFDKSGNAFVMPVSTARPLYLGVRLETREPDANGVRGLRVKQVLPGSPAQAAGLRAEDVLVATEPSQRLGLRQLNTLEELRAVLAAYRPGDVVLINTKRAGKSDAVAITLPDSDSLPLGVGSEPVSSAATNSAACSPSGWTPGPVIRSPSRPSHAP